MTLKLLWLLLKKYLNKNNFIQKGVKCKVEFRTLKANEIDARVAMVKQNGLTLLLYKDARCDMNILDETVGAENWQRNHVLINGNLFCNVGIKCGNEWIWKQDVGTESYTEKEKGQASDSFKRACFNWGIGRELYSAPFIWVKAEDCNIREIKGKYTCSDKFVVKKIVFDDNKKIIALAIKDENTKKWAYVLKPPVENKQQVEMPVGLKR